MKHTILGAGGSIANALAFELIKTKENVRLVSRSNYSIPGTESFKADLTSCKEAMASVQNSDIVYLCAGLPYDSGVWADVWPRVMKNTLDACKNAGAKLVFFDNVYMYGKVDGKMTETTPFNPCSIKGEIRAKLVIQLEREIARNNIKAVIARSADLYGPYATSTSVPYIMVFDKLMYGKKAQWMINANKIHSLTYTIDAAKGMVLLSHNDECLNQTWHLPTCNPSMDGESFIRLVAEELGVKPDYTILKKWMLKLAGFFNKTISESFEMLYQSEFDYCFDSTKFNNYFNYKPLPYSAGIYETIEFLKSKKMAAGKFKTL
jgi:nucleoside-diphosphate-sugar epimerase